MGSSSEELTRLNAALTAATDVAYDWDLATDSIVWFGAVNGLFLTSGSAFAETGAAFNARINPEDLPQRKKALSDHYNAGAEYDCEFRVRQGNGAYCWLHDRGRAVFSVEGKPERVTGVLRLANRWKQHEAQLAHLASYDDLTGLFNRSRTRDMLIDTLRQGQRYGMTGAYLVIGIDKLSLINEIYGYSAADAVIIATGQRIEQLLRSSDTLGRVGGDSFGAVLTRCPVEHMSAVADKVLRAFREQPVRTSFGQFHVNVSIGGVAYPSGAQTGSEVMARAEVALQQAKQAGRNCYMEYTRSDDQRREQRNSVEIGDQVMAALKADRICFAFQPVVDGRTGEVAFYEALMRVVMEDGSIIPASLFVQAIERLGLVRHIDYHTLELAVRELDAHPQVRLALNISGLTVSDGGWLHRLITLLGDRRDIAQRLMVEITETAAMQDFDESARFVRAVRELGCRVALDDFGAGYTSFRHLQALAIDLVKLDGSYVRNLSENRNSLLFVRTLLELANGVGLQTVAECVENEAEAELLRGEGVSFLQGYHFGRPSLERPWLQEAASRLSLPSRPNEKVVPITAARLAG
jgi:diguanylate cyclase (GGDEF)-like protein